MIGIFDSGVGGFSIYKALREELPQVDFHYIADQKHAPYGSKSQKEIQARSRLMVQYLQAVGCELIVAACNTATACAIDILRSEYPDTIFVGVEPGIKPASLVTQNNKIGVLATAATLNSHRYKELKESFGFNLEVYEDSCAGLVNAIENNEDTTKIVSTVLTKMIKRKVDTIVLGCTHFPFIEEEIAEILPEVILVNPASSIARHVGNLVAKSLESATLTVYTTGNVVSIRRFLSKISITPTKIKRMDTI